MKLGFFEQISVSLSIKLANAFKYSNFYYPFIELKYPKFIDFI